MLCRDLQERALVPWTAAELARILAMRGGPSAARSILSEPSTKLADGEPGSATALLTAECVVAMAEDDRATARAKARSAIEVEGGPGAPPNVHAGQVWWAGMLFGADDVGGPETLAEARATLERHHWAQALREPDLVADLLA